MDKSKLNYNISSSKSETSESFYETKEEVPIFNMQIEDEKYSLNKPRRITIKARIIND